MEQKKKKKRKETEKRKGKYDQSMPEWVRERSVDLTYQCTQGKNPLPVSLLSRAALRRASRKRSSHSATSWTSI